jgi:hypothetical protein
MRRCSVRRAVTVPVTVAALGIAAVVGEDPLQPPTSGAHVAGDARNQP